MSRNDFCCNNIIHNNMPFGCGCSASPCFEGVSPCCGVRPAGPQGPQGPQGLQGPAGAAGPQGPMGMAGATGPQGAMGTQGATGPLGPQGTAGATGPQGMQGATGTQGLRGLKGDTGATGMQGPTGMAATIGVETTTRVPFDDNPSVVNVGTPQAAVLRFAIPSGMPGATGEQGPKGDTGAQGATGATGLQGNTGSTGPKGATGPTGIPTFGQINSIIANADLKKDVQSQIPLQYGGESNNVTLAANTITVKETGYYTLSYAMFPYLILTADYADLTLSLRSNGVDIPQTARTVRSTRGTHDLSFYGSTIVWLRAGSVIDSAFMCNEDGKFFFSKDNISSLFLYKIA